MGWIGEEVVLTLKRAEPLRLDKVDPVGGHVLPDEGLRVVLRLVDVRVEERVEPGHAPLARDPADSALAAALERDDLVDAREVRVDEGVEHGPHHLGLGAREADAHQLAHRRARPVGAQHVPAAHDGVVSAVGRHGHRRGGLVDGHAARVEQDVRLLEARGEEPLHDGLPDHEEVLVQRVLEAGPPVVLARGPRAVLVGRAR